MLNDQHDATFPFDDAQTIQTALRNARREIEHVLEGITALEELYGVEPFVPRLPEPGIEQRYSCPHSKFHPNGCPPEPEPAPDFRTATVETITVSPGGTQDRPGGKSWKK